MNTVKTAERLNLIDDKILMPNPRQIEWYNREKIAFIHFGINTFTGKEWGDGTESPELFNPTDIDVDGWIRVVKDAGLKFKIPFIQNVVLYDTRLLNLDPPAQDNG